MNSDKHLREAIGAANDMVQGLGDQVVRLQADNAALREALKGFVDHIDAVGKDYLSPDGIDWPDLLIYYNEARAALRQAARIDTLLTLYSLRG